jgi:hypothetical protein
MRPQGKQECRPWFRKEWRKSGSFLRGTTQLNPILHPLIRAVRIYWDSLYARFYGRDPDEQDS